MPDRCVLVVEDDDELGQSYLELLQYAGYEVKRASDGQAALSHLAKKSPDVVVLDMHLPKSSGEIVLQHIRRESHLSRVRVFVVTADRNLAIQIQPQADAVAVKPLGAAEFLKQVASLAGS